MAGWTPDRRDLRDPIPPRPAAFGEGLPGGARFSRWDGTQTLPALDADELIDAMAEDVLAEGDPEEALRRLIERGWRSDEPTRADLPGLRDLLDRLERRRQEILDRNQLGDVLGDVRRELDEIVGTERAGVERRLAEAAARPRAASSGAAEPGAAEPGAGAEPEPGPDPADIDLRRMLRDVAARRLDRLDALPSDVGGRIRDLRDYDFLESEARERFDALVERLQGQVLDQYFEGLADAIKSTSPEDLAATREMVRDLDQLLQERLAGGDPDAEAFLRKHGRYFPGARTLDDVIEQLGGRMAAMQSLLQSMTPEQRAELQDLTDALLRDDRLRWDLAQLSATLDQVLTGGLGERLRFSGAEPLGLQGALAAISRIQALDALEERLDRIRGPEDLAGIDRNEVRGLLGGEAVGQLDALDDLSRRLEEAGYLTRAGDRLELTPRGARRLGQKVLDDLFARLRRDALGGHRLDRSGRGGEREETSRAYQFGDPFHLDLGATIGNALAREENAPGRRDGRGVSLSPHDFAVFGTEQLTSSATVLLVDMSRSMLLRGCFLAAKKVAIALETLIRTKYPRDHLAVIGFAYYAREIRPEALAGLSWHGYEYGTNLQHGLLLARQFLARQHVANREIVVITDGEPTAHFEHGQVEFSYPPTRRTIQETLREVVRCTKDGITINTFMLERSRSLAEFVALVTRLNRGRAFYASPDRLGEYVLVDFVSRRTRRIS
jgi:uncharacterized protein with von Willebrand factor type A (vWA) domain